MQLPTAEEIEGILADRKLTTIVFFLDETFEELSYDMCTTAQEATEQLAATIKLENHSTFALFDCRRVRSHVKMLCVSSEHHDAQASCIQYAAVIEHKRVIAGASGYASRQR